jgi:hypothetical protein
MRIYASLREQAALRAAARRAKLSTSAFVRRAALTEAKADTLTAKLLQSPSLRGALADIMARPSVVSELGEAIGKAGPAQLRLFRDEMARGLDLAARGKG